MAQAHLNFFPLHYKLLLLGCTIGLDYKIQSYKLVGYFCKIEPIQNSLARMQPGSWIHKNRIMLKLCKPLYVVSCEVRLIHPRHHHRLRPCTTAGAQTGAREKNPVFFSRLDCTGAQKGGEKQTFASGASRCFEEITAPEKSRVLHPVPPSAKERKKVPPCEQQRFFT